MIRLLHRNFDIPELAGSDPKVIAALAKMFEEEQRGKATLSRVQFAQFGSLVFLAVLCWLFWKIVDHTGVKLIVAIIAFFGWVITMGIAGDRAAKRVSAEFVRFVRERCPGGVPLFCLKCNYDLRGSPDGLCPECGAEPMQWDHQPVTQGAARVKLRGRNYDIPELVGCTEDMRRLLAKRFEREGTGRNRIALTQATQLLGFFLAIAIGLATQGYGFALLIVWVIAAGLSGNHATRQLGEDFRAYLRQLCPHGRPRICVACDYDLRASKGPTCPECGAVVPMLMR